VKFEERMAAVMGGMFDRMPVWLRALFVVLTVVGVLVLNVEELQVGMPYWLRITILAPIAILLVFFGIPIVTVALLRIISWPARRASALLRKSH